MRRLFIFAMAVVTLPCAFGYIGENITTGDTPSQTLQITRSDSTGINFYLNTGVVGGLTSPVSGVTVFTASSNPTAAIEAAMASWNNIGSSTNVHFNALQTTTTTEDPLKPAGLCTNIINVGATADDLSVLLYLSPASPGVVAVTSNSIVGTTGIGVCGSTTTVKAGTIVASEILFNPYVAFSTDSTANTQDVQAVMTHEFGHSLGINHSGLIGTTMYPYAAKYERHLSWDEKSFAGTYYSSGTKAFGTISGTVTLAGVPVKYALIVLTDVSGGGKTLGGLTAADGTYSIQVPPGVYNVYAEPFNSFISPTNVYSLSSLTGELDPTQATTAFSATFSGGNSTNPPVFTISAGSSSTANISVIAGATTLTTPAYGVGKAGGNGGISFGSAAAIPLVAGQSYDIGFAGPGIDATISVVFIGTNVTLVGSARVDTSESAVSGGTTYPLVRQTIQIGSQTNTTLGSLWIIKGSSYLPLSGVLDLEPMTPTISNILPLYSSGSAMTSGQYVTVYGSNLSNTTREWNANTDFTGGTTAGSPLPFGLDGVTVTVNSTPAAVFSISPTQVNFIVPSSLASGNASVILSNAGSPAAAFTSTSIAQASPSFFVYGSSSPYYVAAYHADYSLVGDPAVTPGSTKARAGEEIFLYATGLAPANGGTVIAGSEFSQTAVAVTAGGIPLTVAASPTDGKLAPYLIEAGLFQINVIVPATIAGGNYNLTMTVPNGSTATSGISVILPVGP